MKHPEAGWNPTWRTQAQCLGLPSGIFFEEAWSDLREAEVQPGIDTARGICFGCPVKEACMADALNHKDDYGILAGSTPLQRRRIRRRGLGVPAALAYVFASRLDEDDLWEDA